MPEYVDGFVIPLPKKLEAEYRKSAQKAAKIWIEHGALDYRECIAEDLTNDWSAQFPKAAGARSNETVLFSWITFKSRKHRDQVNAKAAADPRLKKIIEEHGELLDCKRMVYGGFKTLVSAAPLSEKRPGETPGKQDRKASSPPRKRKQEKES